MTTNFDHCLLSPESGGACLGLKVTVERTYYSCWLYAAQIYAIVTVQCRMQV